MRSNSGWLRIVSPGSPMISPSGMVMSCNRRARCFLLLYARSCHHARQSDYIVPLLLSLHVLMESLSPRCTRYFIGVSQAYNNRISTIGLSIKQYPLAHWLCLPLSMSPLNETPTVLVSTTSYSFLHLVTPHLISNVPNIPQLLTKPNPSTRLVKPLTNRDHLLVSSKLIGATHSLLSSTLALHLILSPKWKHSDLIETPSNEGDRIVALELGYLLSGWSPPLSPHLWRRIVPMIVYCTDTLALLLTKRKLGDGKLFRRVLAHHLVVGGLMGWYLSAAARNKGKGIFFVASYVVRLNPSSSSTSTPRMKSWSKTETDFKWVDHESLNAFEVSDLVSEAIYICFEERCFGGTWTGYDDLRDGSARTVSLSSSVNNRTTQGKLTRAGCTTSSGCMDSARVSLLPRHSTL